MDIKALKSILQHMVVGLLGGMGIVLSEYATSHPDLHTWTMTSFGAAAFVGLVAVVKKLLAGELLK